jgi:drug/metabolite transporter (DMT)-like permease
VTWRPANPAAIPLVLLLGVVTVSTAPTMIRLAGDPPNGLPPLAIAAGRLGLAALLLLPISAATGALGPRGLRSWTGGDLRLAMVSGLLLALHFAAWISSLALTSVASSVTLVTTTPIWVAIGGALFLGERPGRGALAGIAVATAGAVGLALSDAGGGGPPGGSVGEGVLGDALAVVGAIAGSGYFLAGRALRARRPLTEYVQLAYGVAGIALVVLAGLTGAPLSGYPPAAYLLLLLLALGPQLVGHSSFNWVLRFLAPSTVAAVILAEPIGSMVLASQVLGEPLTLPKALAAAVILSGIYLVAREEGRRAATLTG